MRGRIRLHGCVDLKCTRDPPCVEFASRYADQLLPILFLQQRLRTLGEEVSDDEDEDDDDEDE